MQLLFEATKAHYLLQWLDRTRAHKVLLHKHFDNELHPWDVDSKLALIVGKIYDIRDYVEGGIYSKHKQNMYNVIKINIRFSENINKHTTVANTKDPSSSTLWSGKLSVESEDYYDSRAEEGSHHRHKIILQDHLIPNQTAVSILKKIFKGGK